MKLHPKKVTGSRLVRVVSEHKVNLAGLPIKNPGASLRENSGWGTAKVGDLAVELVWRKTKKVIGWSYLSGECIQAVRYLDEQRRWPPAESSYDPILGTLIVLPDEIEKPTEAEANAFLTVVFTALQAGRYLGATRPIAVFELQVKTAPVQQALDFIMHALHYKMEGPDVPPEADVLGVVTGRDADGKKNGATIHSQAPDRAQTHAATPFQIHMVIDAVKAQPDGGREAIEKIRGVAAGVAARAGEESP